MLLDTVIPSKSVINNIKIQNDTFYIDLGIIIINNFFLNKYIDYIDK